MPPGDRQELDDVTQFSGEFDLGLLKLVDSLKMNVAFVDQDIERKRRQNRQFLCSIAARNVHGGISFGKSKLLRFRQRFAIGPAVSGHLREDEIAGAVDDADKSVDAVGDQAARQSINNGNPTSAARLKRDAGFV